MNAKDRASFINRVGENVSGALPEGRICSNCGAPVKGKFCSKCGTPYAEQQKTEVPQMQWEPPVDETAGVQADPAEVQTDSAEAQAGLAEGQVNPVGVHTAPVEGQAGPEDVQDGTAEAQAEPAQNAAPTMRKAQNSPFEAVKNTIQSNLSLIHI